LSAPRLSNNFRIELGYLRVESMNAEAVNAHTTCLLHSAWCSSLLCANSSRRVFHSNLASFAALHRSYPTRHSMVLALPPHTLLAIRARHVFGVIPERPSPTQADSSRTHRRQWLPPCVHPPPLYNRFLTLCPNTSSSDVLSTGSPLGITATTPCSIGKYSTSARPSSCTYHLIIHTPIPSHSHAGTLSSW
jgi:hypothetical protein